jgi:osmotically inducible protein OsmC
MWMVVWEPGATCSMIIILDVDLGNLQITGIHLDLKASLIDGVSAEAFQQIAEGAKANCIVSKALSAVPITLSVSYK